MIQIFRSLEEISTGYSIFEKDQVLTHDQLNSVAEYNTDETRLTRVKLIGVGIVCGFRLSFADNLLTVTKGAGVTTDGDLAFLENTTIYDQYKPYDKSAPAYAPFYIQEEMITVYELVRQGQTDNRAKPLSQFNANTGSSFNNMLVVLLVESYIHDEDICTATDCDNLGKNSVSDIKILLIDKASMRPLSSSLLTPDQAVRLMNEIAADRPLIAPNIRTVSQLGDLYRTASNSIHGKLVAEFPKLYPNCSFFLNDVFPSDPATEWETKLKSINDSFATNDVGIQYYYDFLKDLVETWNCLRNLLFGDRTWCCPDISSFPKHLLLGNLVPTSNPDENRTPFYPSPITSHAADTLYHAKFLAKKLNTLIQTFENVQADEIRITPSLHEEFSLEERAIPFYYEFKDTDPIHKSWSFSLTKKGMEAYNYSYNASKFGAVGPAANPLNSQIGRFSFFRIEGQLGKNVSAVLSRIENEIKSKNLPIAVRCVMVGEDRTKIFKRPGILYTDLHRFHHLFRKDLDHQLDDVAKFSDSYKNEVNKLTPEVAENVEAIKQIAVEKDSTISTHVKAAHNILKSSYSEYKANAAWKSPLSDTMKAASEFKYNLGEVTKTEFTTPFDSLISATNHHYLDWLDIIIKDKEDKEDEKMLFAKFHAEHPGLEHFAGVVRGGTFILVYDIENKVVGDFMLPYYYPDKIEEEPKEPDLPKPPIKIPWIIDHGIKVGPSLGKYVDKKLGVLETDLDLKWKTKFDLQKESYTDSANILSQVLTYKPKGPGVVTPGERYTDRFLEFKVKEAQNKREMIDYVNARIQDSAVTPEAKATYEAQVKEAQAELAKSIQDTTNYLERSAANVASGTEAHHAIQELATNAVVITDAAVVENVTTGLKGVMEATANPNLRIEIGHVIKRIRPIG